MRTIVAIWALLICGCDRPHPSAEVAKAHVWQKTTILDEVLLSPEYVDAIKQAECDLPDDEWRDKPWRMNLSRERREHPLATRMLADIQPKLKSMSVTELVQGLKLLTYPEGVLTNSFGGVAYYVYRDGNLMIIQEIKLRPKKDLLVLTNLADDKVVVWEGSQGPCATLADVIHHRILLE